MRVVHLKVDNIKRIVAVEVTPGTDVITIGGKNRAGKSSVLDAIAYALGGQSMIPEEPIRHGETHAEVVVDLDDILVTRKFSREVIYDCTTTGVPHEHTELCHKTLGATKSTLVVSSKKGDLGTAKFASPQAMLDKLYGDLTFDPLDFTQLERGEQRAMLMRLSGFSPKPFDDRKREVLDSRNALKKGLDASLAERAKNPTFTDVPEEEVDSAELGKELAAAQRAAAAVTEQQTVIHKRSLGIATTKSGLDACQAAVARIARELEEAQQNLRSYEERHISETGWLILDKKKLEELEAAVPALEVLQQKLIDTEQVNKKVRANKARAAIETDIANREKAIAGETKELGVIEAERIAAIKSLQFPVPGLGFDDNGVTLNGLPFDQAATSEQLAVSVGIGLSLNPAIKVLLVRRGESLDSDSMKVLEELAVQHNAQLWVERMTETGAGVSVMIEAGSIKE